MSTTTKSSKFISYKLIIPAHLSFYLKRGDKSLNLYFRSNLNNEFAYIYVSVYITLNIIDNSIIFVSQSKYESKIKDIIKKIKLLDQKQKSCLYIKIDKTTLLESPATLVQSTPLLINAGSPRELIYRPRPGIEITIQNTPQQIFKIEGKDQKLIDLTMKEIQSILINKVGPCSVSNTFPETLNENK